MLHHHYKLLDQRFLAILVIFLLMSCSGMQVLAGSAACGCKEKKQPVVKYVQGGLTWPGNGTKHAPYKSLALAEQDTSWDVLVVLPSEFALDGGIALRSGTELVGALNPLDCVLHSDQPTITNSSAVSNGGNGVVVKSGSVSIKNIHFKDTWSSAINYDNARNLHVQDVLITGANKGGVTAQLPDPNDPAGANGLYYVGGIQATALHSGHTCLHNVVVRDNYAGQGVAESIKEGKCREFNATHCEFAGLGQLIPATTLARVDGILLMAFGAHTQHKAFIKKCNFHDYNSATIQARHIGFEARPSGGARVAYEMDRCTVSNLNVDPMINPIRGDGVSVVSIDVDPYLPVSQTHWGLIVTKSRFTELFSNTSVAINLQQKSSVSHVEIAGNTMQDFDDCIATFIGGIGARNELVIKNNTVRVLDTCVSTLAWGGALQAINQKMTVKNNNFESGPLPGAALRVIADFEPNSNWADLLIEVKHNCFYGQGPDSRGLAGSDNGINGVGNGTIKAHYNNFTGFATDIFDDKANINYYAQRNWWGQPSGPANVVNLGTGVVNVSNPLQSPIKCSF